LQGKQTRGMVFGCWVFAATGHAAAPLTGIRFPPRCRRAGASLVLFTFDDYLAAPARWNSYVLKGNPSRLDENLQRPLQPRPLFC
jgi:hypothetical protein